jgi:hypothetical protein
MTSRTKLHVLVAISLSVVGLSSVMLVIQANASETIRMAWGGILTVGILTLFRGLRLYKRLP